MRSGIFGTLILLVVFDGQRCLAAGKNAAPQPLDDVATAIDQLAKTLFAAADANHNHVLNKREFADAEDGLDEQVRKWGQAGMIGKPKKKSAKDKEKEPEQSATSTTAATGNRLARQQQSERSGIHVLRSFRR